MGLATLGIVAASPAAASTLVVSNLNDQGTGSLRAAITAANDEGANPGPDTIAFQPGLAGTITLASALPAIERDITINGPGAGTLTVSGAGATRPFTIVSAAGRAIAVNINGLTIANGTAGVGNGGAIFAQGANLTLDRVAISSSSAASGGGVFFNGAYGVSLTVTNSTVSGNQATGTTSSTGGGGGIEVGRGGSFSGNMTLDHDTFSGNTSAFTGGAVDISAPVDSKLQLTSSTISGNHAVDSGSGVRLNGFGSGPWPTSGFKIADTTFSGNTATPGGSSRGGGLYVLYTGTTVERSTFSGNAANAGGGIYARDILMDLTNVTISGNTAKPGAAAFSGDDDYDGYGGGFYSHRANPNFNFVTIANNTARNAGGFMSLIGAAASFNNSIIGDNTATSGHEPDIDDATDGGAIAAKYTLIETMGGSWTAGSGQVHADPKLNPLGSDPSAPGAPQTQTLQATSPALNAGDPAFSPPPATDERGQNRLAGPAVDLGAVEMPVTPPAPSGPVVSVQPGDQSVADGQVATFSAAASGSPAPSVQWQVSTGGAPFSDVGGATSATYSLVAHTADSGKQYRAVFTNVAGTATSNAARLTVGAAGTVVERVNAGGGQVSGSPAWAGDTGSAPSPRSNASASGSTVYTTSSSIDMSDPSVPSGTPMSVVQAQRWDPGSGAEMQWAFPEANGTYEVRLYFAETYSGTARVGGRVFNVNVEGQALNNFDIFAAAGNQMNKAVVKRFTVNVTDGIINVDFGHVVENPSIQAIEIVRG